MLLTENELRSALEPLLDQLLAQRLRHFQLQLEPRMRSLIEAALRETSAGTIGCAGLEAVLAAKHPNQTFQALYAAAREVVGPSLALLVVRQGRATVWKSEGLHLAASFPLANPAGSNDLERGGGAARPVEVRGHTVGLLYWQVPLPLESAAARRLDLLLRTAGAVLLGQAYAPTPQPDRAMPLPLAGPAPAPAPRAAPAAAPIASTAAERFAQLLLDDLELYLLAERRPELEAARRQGAARSCFAPEIERCRRAFGDRFPAAAATLEAAVERILCRAE